MNTLVALLCCVRYRIGHCTHKLGGTMATILHKNIKQIFFTLRTPYKLWSLLFAQNLSILGLKMTELEP